MVTIAIVGAGFSGTAVALNLLRLAHCERLQVQLIDRGAAAGRGLAYGTWDDNHLLNVPAGEMSAFEDEPDHFVRFCREQDAALGAASFVPRRLYGDYLQGLLREAAALRPGVLQLRRDEVVAVEARGHGAELRFADGGLLSADFTVLAPGHGRPCPPVTLADGEPEPGWYIADPWSASALGRIAPDEPVLLVGTGHTAVDVLFTLARQSGERRIVMLSRRGLLPRGHRSTAGAPLPQLAPLPFDPAALRPTALDYLRAVRRQIGRPEADWRDLLRRLRPHTPELWRRLDQRQRRCFVRHLAPIWDVHRHRLAPVASQRLDGLLRDGRVEPIAGRIEACEPAGDGVRVTIRRRGGRGSVVLKVAKVVNCTGPNHDFGAAHPVLRRLGAVGLLRSDPLGLGLEVNRRYELIGADGRPSGVLHYIGPLLKAQDWEAVAVPELRRHAARLAEVLWQKISPALRPNARSATYAHRERA